MAGGDLHIVRCRVPRQALAVGRHGHHDRPHAHAGRRACRRLVQPAQVDRDAHVPEVRELACVVVLAASAQVQSRRLAGANRRHGKYGWGKYTGRLTKNVVLCHWSTEAERPPTPDRPTADRRDEWAQCTILLLLTLALTVQLVLDRNLCGGRKRVGRATPESTFLALPRPVDDDESGGTTGKDLGEGGTARARSETCDGPAAFNFRAAPANTDRAGSKGAGRAGPRHLEKLRQHRQPVAAQLRRLHARLRRWRGGRRRLPLHRQAKGMRRQLACLSRCVPTPTPTASATGQRKDENPPMPPGAGYSALRPPGRPALCCTLTLTVRLARLSTARVPSAKARLAPQTTWTPRSTGGAAWATSQTPFFGRDDAIRSTKSRRRNTTTKGLGESKHRRSVGRNKESIGLDEDDCRHGVKRGGGRGRRRQGGGAGEVLSVLGSWEIVADLKAWGAKKGPHGKAFVDNLDKYWLMAPVWNDELHARMSGGPAASSLTRRR